MKDDAAQSAPERSGDPRSSERRGSERRRTDRRAPPPPWRRPWALVGYGVVGAFALVLLFETFGAEPAPHTVLGDVETAPRKVAVDSLPPAAGAPVQEASAAADYERLIAEGDAAVGRRVHAQLYCAAIQSVALRPSVEHVEQPIAALMDQAGRVPAAECKWGRGTEVRREDFFLLVPPALAERFASAPEVADGFIRRRHIDAEVEWLGRSEALSLRPTGVLRALRAD